MLRLYTVCSILAGTFYCHAARWICVVHRIFVSKTKHFETKPCKSCHPTHFLQLSIRSRTPCRFFVLSLERNKSISHYFDDKTYLKTSCWMWTLVSARMLGARPTPTLNERGNASAAQLCCDAAGCY